MKPTTPVDKSKLRDAIFKAEADGPLKNLSVLWKAVAEIYNQTAEIPISHSVVCLRVQEFGLKCTTQPGRKTKKSKQFLEINDELLILAVAEAEAAGPLPNLTTLWETTARIYNTKSKTPVIAQIVQVQVKKLGISYITKRAKLGTGKRVSRAEKFAANPAISNSIEVLRVTLMQNQAERFLPLVKKIEQGSMAAAVKLNCLECCAFQTSEVKNCGVNQCPLWAFRPYQKGRPLDPDDVPEDEPIDEAEEEAEVEEEKAA